MGDASLRMRFPIEIRWLIQRNTRFGGTAVIHRYKVEEVGVGLGMPEVAACEQFLALQGSLWDVYNGDLAYSMIGSAETSHLEPARRWVAINGVVVLEP